MLIVWNAMDSEILHLGLRGSVIKLEDCTSFGKACAKELVSGPAEYERIFLVTVPGSEWQA